MNSEELDKVLREEHALKPVPAMTAEEQAGFDAAFENLRAEAQRLKARLESEEVRKLRTALAEKEEELQQTQEERDINLLLHEDTKNVLKAKEAENQRLRKVEERLKEDIEYLRKAGKLTNNKLHKVAHDAQIVNRECRKLRKVVEAVKRKETCAKMGQIGPIEGEWMCEKGCEEDRRAVCKALSELDAGREVKSEELPKRGY